MPLVLIAPPAAEPISLTTAKTHLRVGTTDEDALIGALIAAAREQAEHATGRVFITQTWELVMERFPTDGEIRIPLAPVAVVDSVKYYDAAGALLTVPATDYQLSLAELRPRIVPANGKTWPVSAQRLDAVKVRFTAGYGPDEASVPAAIRQWMLLRIGALYEHREAVANGTVAELPRSHVDGLLDPYRVIE